MRHSSLASRRLVLAAFALTALPARAQPAGLQVAAASSLTAVMPALARGFEAQDGGAPIRWHSDGSGLLLDGLALDQPADVLLSADADTVARGVQRRLLRPESARAFAGNALVLVVGKASRLPVQRLTDLARTEVQQIAVARPTSAAVGRYARQAIDAHRLWASVQRKIVATPSVRASMDLLLRADVDAAIVYRTDSLAAGAEVRIVEQLGGHEPIRLTAAVTQGSRQVERATRFVQYLRSDAAQALLVAAGFSAL